MAKKTDSKEVKELQKQLKDLEKQVAANKADINRKRFSWRTPIVFICVVLAGATFSTGAVAFAFNRTINDPAAYMRSVGPIIDQPEVQKAIVKKAQDAIQKNVNVQEIVTEALPPQAAFLAAPITAQVNSHIDSFLTKVVSSDKFSQVWYNVNLKLHNSTLAAVKQSGGDPNIDVSELYKFLSSQLEGTPLSAVANKSLPPKVGNLKVTNAKWIPPAHRTLADLPWIQNVGLALSVVFGALAVYLSKKRHQTGTILALWLSLLMAVTLGSLAASKSVALQGVTDPTYNAAAGAIWDVVLAPMYGYLATLITLGVIGALITWVTGGSRPARSLQRATNKASVATHKFIFRGHDNNPAFDYLHKYRRGLDWLILIVPLGLFLFVFRPLTVNIVLTSTLIAAVVAAVLEVISAKSK